MPLEKQKQDLTGTPTLNALFISLDKNLLSEKQGDALKRHLRYANYFNKLNVIVFTLKKDGFKNPKKQNNLLIIPTNSLPRWFFVWDAVKIALSLHKKQKIHIVSSQDPFITAVAAIIIKLKTKAKLNIQIHNDFFANRFWKRESLQNWIFYFIGRNTLKKASTIRVVSEKIESSVKKFIPPRIMIRKIPINPSVSFIKEKSREKNYIDIISVGRLENQKNYSLLLNAVALVKKEIPEIKVHIVGEGSQESLLKQLAKKLDINKNVVFEGKLRQNEVIRNVIKSKIFVSASKYEGMSIALREAMLAGLPVVATEVSGSEDVIENGINGFLVPFSNELLAEKIKTLLKNEKLQKRMGINAKRRMFKEMNTNWEKQWIDLLAVTAGEDDNIKKMNIKMKRANIKHYNRSHCEIEKANTHPSKIIYYPKLVNWLRKKIKPNQVIIDVGGGAGVIMSRLKEEIAGLTVVGLDISLLMTKLRSSIGLKSNIVADIEQMPIKSNSLDSVIFIASLHHTLNTDKAIHESCRILKPGGKLLLIEHNSFQRLFYFWKRGAIPAPDDPKECLINHHFITEQIEKAGFTILERSVHRQLATIAEGFSRSMPLWLYKAISIIDSLTYWIPGYKEIGSLMLVDATKPL